MVLDFVPWARMFQGTDANLPVFAELHGLFDRQLRTEVDLIVRHQKVRHGDGSGSKKMWWPGQRGSCDP